MARRLSTWVAGFLLLGPWAGVASAQAPRPRIAVMRVTAEHLGADVRDKLSAAVAGGLAAGGAEVVDSLATSRRLAARGLEGCETSNCRIAIADATGARYLMRGRVETMGRSYTVHLEMIDGTTGAVIGVREDRCEICTENEAYETASVTASALKAEVLRRPATPPDDDHRPARPVVTPRDPTGQGDQNPGLTITTPGSGGGRPDQAPAPRLRALSWIAIGAGAAAIGGGIFLLSINHDLTCDHEPGGNCEFRYATRTWGIVSITGGALAAALGTTLLVGRF